MRVPRAVAVGLRAVARSEGATAFMTVLAAFKVLLGRYAATEDLVVGTVVPGRARAEVQGLIGVFVNTLVLRTGLSGDPSFREVVRRTRETVLGAHEHQDLPFERLVEALQPERSLSHSSLFQVLFQLDRVDEPALAARPGLRVQGAEAGLKTARFDLSLLLTATPQGIGGVLEYSTDLFDRSTVRRMLGHLERVLEQVAADADVRLSRLELLSAEERGLVVDAWNRTERDSVDPPAHRLFAEWARRAPEAERLFARPAFSERFSS